MRSAGGGVRPRRAALGGLVRLAELGVLVVLYEVYAALRDAQGRGQPAPGPTAVARGHAEAVLHVERLLGLDVEHGVQALALRLPRGVVQWADLYYAGVHLPLTAAVLLVLVLGPGQRWRRGWTSLVLGTALALAVFAAAPTMPPRLLGGYVATLGTYAGPGGMALPRFEHIAHPYAAMPSLHLVWAAWVAAAAWRWSWSARWRWVRALGPVHVLLTALVVLVTGNHWLVDVVAGIALWVVVDMVAGRAAGAGRARGRGGVQRAAAGGLTLGAWRTSQR